MPNLGSSSNPSWAGWDYPGSGYGFAAGYTTPNFDILVLEIHAYFDTFSGSGAQGKPMVWDGHASLGYPILINPPNQGINNGSQRAGGQQWYGVALATPVLVTANSPIQIGAWCNQGMLFSTYDTSPQTYIKSMGNSPTSLAGKSNTGQGPCGGFIIYSQVVYGSQDTEGGGPGGLYNPSGIVGVLGSVDHMGGGPGGLVIPATIVKSVAVTTLGNDNQNGLLASGTVRVPTVKVWRPN